MWTVSWFYRKICGYMGENEDCDSKYYKQLLMQLIFFLIGEIMKKEREQ